MEKTGKQRHLYFMRVSENCKLLTELYVVPDEVNHQQSWFEDRHLQEIIILLRDPIKSKVLSYYEQYRRKKWSGIKEGNDSKKKPIQDEHQIKTGQSVKIGYKFVDSNMHHPSCLMPTEMGTPVWKDDNSRHAGGGFSPVRLFAKKLVVYVCKYHTATIGQTTSQLMKSLCATPPSKHIAISSYFAPKADADFVGPPVIQSAHRKRNKLKKIVKGMNTAAAAAGTKESIDVGCGLKGGGFFEKASGNMDTETQDEIKPEVLPFPSVSDMDCGSDGMPDQEEQNERLDGHHRSPAECKDGLSLRPGEHSRRGLPLSPQEERSRKTTVTSSVKPDEDPIKVEGNEHPQFSDVSKPFTCKLEKIEDASVDLPQKANVSSSERTSSPSTYESRLKDSLKSIKSEATLQSSSVEQESGVTRLTCSSEVTGSSPSSSGEFDHRIRRRENTRSRNKLSLKRNEAKRGSASKVGSSKEKVLHEDVKKESVEEALMGHEVHGTKKQKLHNDTVPEKDRVSVNKRSNNISESVNRHPAGNCSVFLTDIKLKHDKSLDEPLRSTTSFLKRPMKNQQDISPSPEKETTPNSSSDDELMSASFLHAENRPLNPAKEVKESRQQPPLQTTQYEDRKVNGVRELDTASSGCEQRDSFHSTTNKSVQNVEDNENTKHKRPKPSRLALFTRQNNRNKDSLHNIPKALHGEKKRKQKTNLGQLMEDLEWDSDSQETKEDKRASEAIHRPKIEDKLRRSEEDEPMDVDDALPKLTPIEDVGCAFDEVEALPSDHHNLDDLDQGTSPPELKRDDPVHISDDSCGGDVMDDIKVEEEEENAPMGASREGKLGDLEDEVIDLSQGKDDDDESDSWFDNIFGNVRGPVKDTSATRKKDLIEYMDYLSKVLLPEAMSKIYMEVHGVSHAHAEEVMKGIQKEHPRGT
ncbi:uncharacterized protein LOC100891944 isoform X2 [Strongylocentrotus purpuratus]|uniref:Uncharacterized protein n=1 Tax=Strongylocentrotus purpuratus TaxID=7668 RepID=A0A7M7PRV5_STRPU|nr:uncharacterized protein LOC100891944 isoform X2 [Strongylocentrotus purpuratus]